MAQESIDNYLEQIFNNRRYCSHCGAMTPILYANKVKPGAVATSGLYGVDVCECCTHPYKHLPLQKLFVQETYGIAIINDEVVNL